MSFTDFFQGTRPERATGFIETTRGFLSCDQLAPLLGEHTKPRP